MSGEAESKIESVFVDKLGARYPIVKVDKGDVAGYGIRFYPSIYCIDPDGNVHSVPDDRMPSESTIEELLKSVSLAPKLPEGSQYSALRSMWEKKQHEKIRDYLAKMLAQPNLDADMREVFEAQQQALDKRIDAQMKKIERLAAGPDYFAAAESLEKITKDWKGLPVADRAEQELDRFKSDATIKKEIASGRSLDKLLNRYDRSKRSQARKLMQALLKFTKSKKHAGTYAAAKARKILEG